MRTRTLAAVGLVVAVVAWHSAASAQTVVAKMKVHNPSDKAIANGLVRGNLPLPRGYDKPISSLALRDGGRTLLTQVSVFATYAGSDKQNPVGRPEVVQLSARTDLAAGAFKEFDVVELAKPSKPTSRAAAGAALAKALAGKAPVVVEATDCFGNRYRASVLDEAWLIETRQAGPVLTEKVYQAILTPTGKAAAGKPAFKKFLRVRAYLTQPAGEDLAFLNLMIHNGSVDHPNGDVYYGEIRVGVAEPMGLSVWRQRFSPATDGKQAAADGYTWLTCPPALDDGKVYVMRDGAAAVLRTAIYAPAAKARADQLLANPTYLVPTPSQKLFSWSNFATARYGAGKYPIPLSLPAGAAARVGKRAEDALASPTLGNQLFYLSRKPPMGVANMGHAMPGGGTYGGETGGYGIYFVYGHRAAITAHSAAIQMHVMMADRQWDRQRAHLFHDDGKPYTHSRRLVEVGGKKLLDATNTAFLARRKLKGEDPAGKVQADYVKSQGLLSPQGQALMKFMDLDDQHLSRLFDAEPAAYLACDSVNRDRLVTLGTQACWKMNVYPLKGKPNTGGWGSLVGARKHVDAKPHQGINWGREHGWIPHSLAYAFFLSQDKQIRADCLDVARANVYIREKAQMPGGNVTLRPPSGKAESGLHAARGTKPGPDGPKYWFTTAWEEGAVNADGARCMVEMLSSPADAALAETLKKVYARVGKWTATVAWDEKAHNLAFFVGVRLKGEKDVLEEPVLVNSGSFYMGTPFAWYYELTGDKLFLDRMKEVARGKLKAYCLRDMYGDNWTYPLWLLEGGRIPGRKPMAKE